MKLQPKQQLWMARSGIAKAKEIVSGCIANGSASEMDVLEEVEEMQSSLIDLLIKMDQVILMALEDDNARDLIYGPKDES